MQDPVTVRKNLGRRVRALRLKKKWSQEDLSHESGLARSFTGAIERGEKGSAPDHSREIGEHLPYTDQPAVQVMRLRPLGNWLVNI